MSKPVFISYSTDDAPSASAIRDGLEAAGIPCWMAPRDIVPGADYAEQIIGAIEACTVMVLVLSETSNQSRFVRNEVERAMTKGKTVIPVRIHNVTPSRSLEFFVSNAQWIDAWQLPLEATIGVLTVAIGTHSVKVEVAPAAPMSSPPRVAAQAPGLVVETAMVGRVKERADLQTVLTAPGTRLVTLLGPGGIGKTTLASSAAASLHHRFSDGVFEVALAALVQGDQIYSAIADAMALKTTSDLPLPQQLCAHLAGKRTLLVLDNVEQLADGAAHIRALLDCAPDARMLTTSRERLNLRDEVLFRLDGLAVPAEDADASNESIALFLRYALRVNTDLVVDHRALAQIARVCRLVGGTPLAIVLAASSADALTLQEIGDEVTSSLDVLETEMHDLPARQRSMRGVLDSTWTRLSGAEQQAFARLSLFRGGFTREAALAVTGMNVRTLIGLHGKSLVRNDEGRYSIHELVRQFAAMKLTASGERQMVEAGFAGYFLGRLAAKGPALQAREMQAVVEIDLDFANVRQAWSLAAGGEAHLIDRGLDALTQFCLLHGRMGDACALLTLAIEHVADEGLKMRLLEKRAHAFEITAEFAREIVDAETVLKHFRAIGDERKVILLLSRQGFAYSKLSRFDVAQQAFSEALDTCRKLGDTHAEAFALYLLARVFNTRGNFARGQMLCEQAITIVAANGYTDSVAYQALYGLGGALVFRGMHTAAHPVLSKALDLARQHNDDLYQLNALGFLGSSHGSQGMALLDKAIPCYEQSIVIGDAAQMHGNTGWSHAGLAFAHAWLGDYRQAIEHATLATIAAATAGEGFHAMANLSCIGLIYQDLGLLELALANHARAMGQMRDLKFSSYWGPVLAAESIDRIRMGKFDEALRSDLEHARAEAEREGSYQHLSELLVALCEYHLATADFPLALSVAQESLRVSREWEMHGRYAKSLIALGTAQVALGHADEGVASLHEALALAQTNRYHRVQIDAHRALQRAYAHTGDQAKREQHRTAAEGLIAQIRVNLKDRPDLLVGLHTL